MMLPRVLAVFVGLFCGEEMLSASQAYDLSGVLGFDPAEQRKLAQSANIASFPAKATFQNDGHELRYLAIAHSADPDSPTHRMIRKEIEEFQPSLLILEGFGNSEFWVDCIKEYSQKPDEYPFEPCYAARLAQEREIPFIGGEPEDQEIIEAVERKGYTKDDIAYLYIIQQIGQKWHLFKLLEPDLSHIFANCAEMWRELFGKNYTLEDYQGWCAAANERVLTLEELINPENTEPLSDGSKLQRISHEVMIVRDHTIVQRILESMKTYDKVMVVYGGSHYYCQHKVLQQQLGNPTYCPEPN